MTERHRFLWFDLETTGLDPHAPGALILEWAAVLADDAPGGTLAPVAQYASAVHLPDMPAVRARCDLAVQDMHTRSGLWADCADPKRSASLADGEACLLSLVPPRGLVHLAGASVHFDLGWIRVHMPALAKRVHHRVLDVSALWLAQQTWGPPVESAPRGGHRALADILTTLDDARRLRAAMGWEPKGTDR